jgi:predicted Zn-dependent protease
LIPLRLEIAVLGSFEPPHLLPWLAGELERRFRFEDVTTVVLPVQGEWRAAGDRLSSNAIVDALIERSENDAISHEARWTLAVTDLDLAAPGRDYVFGEAALGGGWAVVSTFRLADDGGATDPEDCLRTRFLTEVVHELGHLAGVSHCQTPGCVMLPSATPRDADRKGPHFCPACELRIPPSCALVLRLTTG